MKTRKILPLVLIVVGAAFLLSSCDAMLDAIYPSNQISVQVAVSRAGHPYFNYAGQYVQVQLVGPGINSTATASWSSYDFYYSYYYFAFTKLPDGTYTVYANYVGTPPGYATPYSVTMPVSGAPDSTGHSVTIPVTIY